MDVPFLTTFLCVGFWLYTALSLGVTDWRWNRGRVVQTALLGGFGLAALLLQRGGGVVFPSASALFLVTAALPALARRRWVRALTRQNDRAARFWLAVLHVFAWTRRTEAEAAVARLRALAQTRLAQPEALARYASTLAPIVLAPSRRTAHAARVLALVSLHQYEDALRFFDALPPAERSAPEAALLYLIALAQVETHRPEAAVQSLMEGDAAADAATAWPAPRFYACLRLFALAGRPDLVRALFDRLPRQAAASPACVRPLWLGMAHYHAGAMDDARRALEQARLVITVEDEALRPALDRYLALTQPDAAPPSPPSGAWLGALDRIAIPPPAATPPYATLWPRATLALVAALVLVWLLTEWVGSSVDTRTLLRLGANAPGLTTHGEGWRLLTSVFLHVGLLHLLFNGYALWIFGDFVERAVGRWGMFVTFIVSGVAGSAASAWLGRHAISAGASGAVFGLLGAAIVIVLRTRRATAPALHRIQLVNFLFLAGVNMLFGLLDARIDNLAHAGGFAAGILCGLGLTHPARGAARRALTHIAGVLCASALAASVLHGIAYARAGGYPRVLPPFHPVQAPGGAWRMATPVFWEPLLRVPDQMAFQDPFGGAVWAVLRSEPVRFPPRGVLHQGMRTVGDRLWAETLVLDGSGGSLRLRWLCRTRVRGQHAAIVFEWGIAGPEEAKRAVNDHRGLVDAVLKSFQATPVTPPRISPASDTASAPRS